VAMKVGSVVTYLHSDHLGSTSVTTNASGQCTSSQWYYAYGNVRTPAPTTPCSGALPTDYTFTGQKRDASAGLMFYNARYYDTTLGRFISADTIVPSAGNPQSLNRYAYVYNNPVRYTDPSGHCLFCAVFYAIWEFFANPSSAGGDLYDSQTGEPCIDGCVSDSPTNPELALRVTVDVTTAEVGGKVAGKAIGVAKVPARKVLGAAGEVIGTTSIGLAYRAGMRRFIGIGEEAIAPIVARFGASAASKVPMRGGDLPSQFAGRRIWALGSQSATEAAAKAGDLRFNIPKGWTPESNFDWIYEAIRNRDIFHLVSPVTRKALSDVDWGIKVYGRELDALLQSGYTRIGDYLIPPP